MTVEHFIHLVNVGIVATAVLVLAWTIADEIAAVISEHRRDVSPDDTPKPPQEGVPEASGAEDVCLPHTDREIVSGASTPPICTSKKGDH